MGVGGAQGQLEGQWVLEKGALLSTPSGVPSEQAAARWREGEWSGSLLDCAAGWGIAPGAKEKTFSPLQVRTYKVLVTTPLLRFPPPD